MKLVWVVGVLLAAVLTCDTELCSKWVRHGKMQYYAWSVRASNAHNFTVTSGRSVLHQVDALARTAEA